MRKLLELLYRFRTFFFFLFLEGIAIFMVIRFNSYQNSAFLNSSNALVGAILETGDNVSDYFVLKERNQGLSGDFAQLEEEYKRLQSQHEELSRSYSRLLSMTDSLGGMDSTLIAPTVPTDTFVSLTYIPAKVISNSVYHNQNFITLNKGANDSLAPNMGIICPQGVVGKIVAVSDNYATVRSVLHPKTIISAQISSSKVIGSVKWKEREDDKVLGQLLYIPRHVSVQVGDTVITSGYNAVYPEGTPIGIIEEVHLKDDQTFHDITINFSTDFNSLYYVYAVDHKRKQEKEELEKATQDGL